jgi:putative MATE family efflux protein
VAREVLRLALPAIGHSLLETLLFLVDRAVLGRYGSSALASMQISGPLTWSLLSVSGAFAVGVVAMVGRAIGAKDRELASAALRAGLVLAVVLGGAAATAVFVGIDALLAAFGAASEEVRAASRDYLLTLAPAMPLLLCVGVAAAALQAAGDTRTPFVVAAFGNVLNAVLDWVLVFGELGAPRMGAAGAALGTASAMALQAAGLAVVLSRRDAAVSLRAPSGVGTIAASTDASTREALRRVLRVSGPAFAEKLVQHAGFFGFVTLIGALGPLVMAANQVMVSLESVCFLSADGFGIAAAAVVAQRLGAGDRVGAAHAARVATALGTATLTAMGLLFVAVPGPLLEAFSPDGRVVRTALPAMGVAALAQPFMAVGVVLGQAVRGAGATRVALVVTLTGGLLVRLLATWLLTHVLRLALVGVWLGSTCDWIVRTALFALAWRSGGWVRARV